MKRQKYEKPVFLFFLLTLFFSKLYDTNYLQSFILFSCMYVHFD